MVLVDLSSWYVIFCEMKSNEYPPVGTTPCHAASSNGERGGKIVVIIKVYNAVPESTLKARGRGGTYYSMLLL